MDTTHAAEDRMAANTKIHELKGTLARCWREIDYLRRELKCVTEDGMAANTKIHELKVELADTQAAFIQKQRELTDAEDKLLVTLEAEQTCPFWNEYDGKFVCHISGHEARCVRGEPESCPLLDTGERLWQEQPGDLLDAEFRMGLEIGWVMGVGRKEKEVVE